MCSENTKIKLTYKSMSVVRELIRFARLKRKKLIAILYFIDYTALVGQLLTGSASD